MPIDIARPEFRALILRGSWNAISLTGAAHTFDFYRRLPHGWRPAPPGVWTDLHMWQQLVAVPGFRGRTACRVTHLHLADTQRLDKLVTERVAELGYWWNRIHEPGFAEALAKEVADAVRDGAIWREAKIHELADALTEIQATRSWRLQTWLTNAWRRGHVGPSESHP